MANRKPVNLKVLHGNPGNREVTSERKSATGIPTPPASLKGEAYAEWVRVTTFLARVGHIETVDYAALTVYCTAWAAFEDARGSFEKYGSLLVGRDGGLVKNPAAQIMRDSADLMLKFGARFGFTPKDRQNMGLADGDDGDDLNDALDAL